METELNDIFDPQKCGIFFGLDNTHHVIYDKDRRTGPGQISKNLSFFIHCSPLQILHKLGLLCVELLLGDDTPVQKCSVFHQFICGIGGGCRLGRIRTCIIVSRAVSGAEPSCGNMNDVDDIKVTPFFCVQGQILRAWVLPHGDLPTKLKKISTFCRRLPSKLLQAAKCSLFPQSGQNRSPENNPCRSFRCRIPATPESTANS